MSALHTMWAACIGLYEETLALLIANLAWIALNLPFILVPLVVLLPLVGEAATQGLLVMFAWLLLFVPTPAGLALAGLAHVAAGPDIPRLGVFWSSLRLHWRLGLAAALLSLLGTLLTLGGAYIWLVFGTGLVRFLTIPWLYAAIFWLCMQVYVAALAVYVGKPRVLDLYRRAALIVLGHPGYSVLVLFGSAVIGLLSVVFLPAYVLIGGAYVAMVQAHALREIRRRHGDLDPGLDDEASAL